MSARVWRVAVVGHTNFGKTSLLRTLLRDTGFGEVSPRHGTTRHVEATQLLAGGEPVLALFDTPGLEDAVALRDHMEAQTPGVARLDGPQRVRRFLDSPLAAGRFEQEAKVLRQLLDSDAALLVIDAREPVLAKYRDELHILQWAGRPLLPVLNFVADGQARSEDWRAALAQAGLHALVRFDTVAPPADAETLLYDSLGLLLQDARPALQRVLDERADQAERRRGAVARAVADLLIDVAACRRPVANDAQSIAEAVRRLHADVRQREQRCIDTLLEIHAFRPQDAQPGELPLLDGRWSADLFAPETLRAAGVKLGGGMAAGAAAGVGVDLMVGGITLGAAALLGALVGGGVQTARNYGERVRARWRGHQELTVDDAILRLLALRQQSLAQALERRGHAATEALQLTSPEQDTWRRGPLPAALQVARSHPGWSSLGDEAPRHARDDPRRQARQAELAQQLLHQAGREPAG